MEADQLSGRTRTGRGISHPEAGLTVLELAVVAFILTALVAMVYGTFRFQHFSQRAETSLDVTQRGIRVWVQRMVQDIRNAAYDPIGGGATFGFVEATSTAVRFTLDVPPYGTYDASSVAENVGYRILNPVGGFGTLQLWQGGTTWRTLLPDASLTLRYYNNQGVEMSAPVPLTAIRRVDIALSAKFSGGFPGATAPVVGDRASAEVRNSEAD